MRVVITGATGNVGTSLVERLGTEEAVEEIVGVARRRTDWAPAKTRWVQADVTRDDLRPVLSGAGAVVHLAWVFHPTRRNELTWENNVRGTIRVLDAAAEAGVRTVVVASSVGAYAPGPDDRRVDESWPTHALPVAAYGREKSYVERLLDIFERDHPDVRVVRLRPGFIFKRSSAAEQRRYFAGPFLPSRLVRPGLIPVVPDMPGLALQALHSRDAAEAYRLALVRDVRGAFNVAAEPVLDATALAGLLGARVVGVPAWLPRTALSAAWRLHLAPATPGLFELALSLPVMDTTRATRELGWSATASALEAVREVLTGMREDAGGRTPPLAADAGGAARHKELKTGVGQAGGVTEDGR